METLNHMLSVKINVLMSICCRYHHITVLAYSFFCLSQYTANARWFILMNYTVHSIMYSYYACRALR